MNLDVTSVATGPWRYRAPPPLSDAQFERWLICLEQRTGISYLRHKSILQAGLNRRMSVIGCVDYDRYYAGVQEAGTGALEWGELLNCITIQETRFFRDAAAFACLEEYLLQRVASAERAGGALELWSAGCATGEEAWSMAMVAERSIAITGSSLYFGVTGSDISAAALRVARAGSYPSARWCHIDPQLRQSYALPDSGTLQIGEALGQRACFVLSNLVDGDAALDIDMDVIFCQNVLIYFRPACRRRVLDNLVARLKPGGLLVVGQGESLGWRHANVCRVRTRQVEAYLRHSTKP
jgi:type IV pilus assembly protein PilK